MIDNQRKKYTVIMYKKAFLANLNLDLQIKNSSRK